MIAREPGRPYKIGFFDSGLGGLSVVRSLMSRDFPGSVPPAFVYLADTARCPYGNRSFAEISLFAEQICRFLCNAGVDAIVIACNTSAAIAGSVARKTSTVPVFDVIRPTAELFAERSGKVAVLATSNTCKTRVFSTSINTVNSNVQVEEIACPDLVPLVEAGSLASQESRAAVERYVSKVEAIGADSVILGCTHFPFLSRMFRELLPQEIDLIDPAEHIQLPGLSRASGHMVADSEYQRHTYFTTGDNDMFAQAAERCLHILPGTLAGAVCSVSTDDLELLTRAPSLPREGRTAEFNLLGSHLPPAPQGA